MKYIIDIPDDTSYVNVVKVIEGDVANVKTLRLAEMEKCDPDQMQQDSYFLGVEDGRKLGQYEVWDFAKKVRWADFVDATEMEEFELDKPLLKTTGCNRTGCVLCAYGCHLEKGESRFERLKKTHPKHYALLDKLTNSGVTYREAIDWINEHNGKGTIIRY